MADQVRRVLDGDIRAACTDGNSETRPSDQATGVVILDGRIDSAAGKDAAARHAWSTPGVHDVCNRLVSVA